MSDKTYYENAGKGDHRRKEDTKAFEKNFDGIDWSVKSSTCPKCHSSECACVKVQE